MKINPKELRRKILKIRVLNPNLTVNDICNELHISTATYYRYYKNHRFSSDPKIKKRFGLKTFVKYCLNVNPYLSFAVLLLAIDAGLRIWGI